MVEQMSRSTLSRVVGYIGDKDNITKCKEVLNDCYQIFQVRPRTEGRQHGLPHMQIQSSITLRLQLSEEQEKLPSVGLPPWHFIDIVFIVSASVEFKS